MTDSTDSERAELKPCPFCGGEDIRVHTGRDLGSWGSCLSCGLEAPSETGVTREQAVEYWNTGASHGNAGGAVAESKAKAALAYLLEKIVYADSYGVEGSGFAACYLCSGGGAPGVPMVHEPGCPVLRCEEIADQWWTEKFDEQQEELHDIIKAKDAQLFVAEQELEKLRALSRPLPKGGAETQPRAGGIGVDWWAESVRLYRKNKKLKKALKEHHDWHLSQGEQDFGDGIKLNMADEYADSGMCERTIAALDEAVTPSPVPSSGEVVALERLKFSIDARLNAVLCEMKPDYDDSIVGFNEAWYIVHKAFKEYIERAASPAEAAGQTTPNFEAAAMANMRRGRDVMMIARGVFLVAFILAIGWTVSWAEGALPIRAAMAIAMFSGALLATVTIGIVSRR